MCMKIPLFSIHQRRALQTNHLFPSKLADYTSFILVQFLHCIVRDCGCEWYVGLHVTFGYKAWNVCKIKCKENVWSHLYMDLQFHRGSGGRGALVQVVDIGITIIYKHLGIATFFLWLCLYESIPVINTLNIWPTY